MTFDFEPEPLPPLEPSDMASAQVVAFIFMALSGGVMGFGLGLLFAGALR